METLATVAVPRPSLIRELPADVDRDRLFAMAAGPIYFRKFIASQPVTDDWVRSVANQVCDSFGVPRQA